MLLLILSLSVGGQESIIIDLSAMGWLASFAGDEDEGTPSNHANIVSDTDQYGAYYGMEWRSPEPTDLSLLEINVSNTVGIEEIAVTMSCTEPMMVDVWLKTSGDYCEQDWVDAKIRSSLEVGTTPKVFMLALDDFVTGAGQTCDANLHSDALDQAYSLVLFPESVAGELRIYSIEFRGASVSGSWCDSFEQPNLLQNGSFEIPTISQAIAQGAEGEPGDAAWCLNVSGWEHSEETGYCRLFVVDGSQCFYWNDPVDAWLEQTVPWEMLQAEVGDQVEMKFWARTYRSDGAIEAGKTFAAGAQLQSGDQVIDSVSLTGEHEAALIALSFEIRDEHVGQPVTVRFWADGNEGWSGPEEVQSVYLDRVTLTLAESLRPLRAYGLCSPIPDPVPGVDVTVEFPTPDYYMVFDPPQGGFYHVNETYAFGNEWAETNVRGDCYEVGFDWNARMWIEQASPARVVVGFRGALVNNRGQVAHSDRASGSPYGGGDWADEWFYIYPNGIAARHVRIYTGYAQGASSFWWPGASAGFETQETFIRGLIHGNQPIDDIRVHAVTLAKMNGLYQQFSFSPYPEEEDMYPGANIQIVNVRDAYKPFTIVPEGNTDIMPYWGPPIDQARLGTTTFVAWPRIPYFEEGYMCALTHVINRSWHRQTANTLEQIYLLGLTDIEREADRVASVVQLARSWQFAPDVVVEGTDYVLEEYRIEEKAYHVTKQGVASSSVSMTFQATEQQPLVDPCVVIHGWERDSAFAVYLDDRLLEEGIEYTQGWETQEGGSRPLVLWIDTESTAPVELRVQPSG